MSIYLIDFENLRNEALVGIEQLTKEDRVYLFYSNHADSISFEMHQALMRCDALISYYKIRRGGKNSLDFQLTCQLSYLMGIVENELFYIVSRDNGFTFVRDFWEEHPTGGNTVKRCTSIQYSLQARHAEPVSVDITEISEELEDIPSQETNDDEIQLVEEPEEVIPSETTALETEPEQKPDRPESETASADPLSEEIQVKPQRLRKRSSKTPRTTPKPERAKPPQTAKKMSLQKALSVMLKETCDNATMQKVANLLTASESKQEFYRSVVSLMGQKRGLELYHVIGGEYHHLKNECDCM